MYAPYENIQRCQWVGSDGLMVQYHDNEWGVPTHDETLLFELLTLEGAQAGLSWSTILKKRENYKIAFDNFDIGKIASYSSDKVENLLSHSSGIVKNRLKIESVISNAQAFIKIEHRYGSFDNYLWSFTDGKTIKNHWRSHLEIPQDTKESRKLSKELKKNGFKFVGPTICYSFMQAAGLVNDHTVDCFKY
ncbi:MAG: DNA-3-methyladenine glycosylase I [Desulfamplus sp.]|nr:DNA-3-methyladenine glycosylase I [Desulfamplus sp.]